MIKTMKTDTTLIVAIFVAGSFLKGCLIKPTIDKLNGSNEINANTLKFIHEGNRFV